MRQFDRAPIALLVVSLSIAFSAADVGAEENEFSITDFGAVADDGNDDTSAIQAAIAAAESAGGGAVLIPAGVFQVAASEGRALLISDNGVVLVGIGSESQIAMAHDLSSGGAWLLEVNFADTVRIRDLSMTTTFTGGSAALSMSMGCIQARTGSFNPLEGFEVSGCTFRQTGPDLGSNQRYHVIAVTTDTITQPVTGHNLLGVRIVNNEFIDAAGKQIVVGRGLGGEISGNVLRRPSWAHQHGGGGISLLACKDMLVANNVIDARNLEGGVCNGLFLSTQSPSAGLPTSDLLACDNIQISRNLICLDTNRFAAELIGAKDCVFEENVFGGSGLARDGIRLSSSELAGGNARHRFTGNGIAGFPIFPIRIGTGGGIAPADTRIDHNWLDKPVGGAHIADGGTRTVVDSNILTHYEGPCCILRDEPGEFQPFTDFDVDGDLDALDFAAFQTCVSSAPPLSVHCLAVFDYDCDGMIGSEDQATFLLLATTTFDVRDFGAVGDGVTDDTGAIQATIDTAGAALNPAVVLFPPGTYRIAGQPGEALSVRTSDITLRGLGDASRLVMEQAVGGEDLWMVSASAVNNVRIQDLIFELTISEPVSAGQGGCIRFQSDDGQGCDGFEVTGCSFRAAIPEASPIEIINILVETTPYESPLDQRFMTNGVISGNVFEDSAGVQISLDRAEGVMITGNRMMNPNLGHSGGQGIAMTACADVQILDNVISGSGYEADGFLGLYLKAQGSGGVGLSPEDRLPCELVTISGNELCMEESSLGLSFLGAHDVDVTGNMIGGHGGGIDGIRLWHTDDAQGNRNVSISENDISGWPIFCIRIGSGTGIPPSGTIVRNNWLDHPTDDRFVLNLGTGSVIEGNDTTTGENPCCLLRAEPGTRVVPGDLDGDLEVGAGDIASFFACMASEGKGPAVSACIEAFDVNCDGLVAMDDLEQFVEGLEIEFPVEEFGAFADDGVDDTIAIGVAIELAGMIGGGTVRFSPGRYDLHVEGSAAVTVATDQIHLAGVPNETVLRLSHDLGVESGWIMRVAGAEGFSVSGLIFEANYSVSDPDVTGESGGLWISSIGGIGSNSFEVADCRFNIGTQNPGDDQGVHSLLVSPDPVDFGEPAVVMDSGIIRDNQFQGAGGTQIRIRRSRFVTMADNDIVVDLTKAGQSVGIAMDGCSFSSAVRNRISLSGTFDSVLTGLSISADRSSLDPKDVAVSTRCNASDNVVCLQGPGVGAVVSESIDSIIGQNVFGGNELASDGVRVVSPAGGIASERTGIIANRIARFVSLGVRIGEGGGPQPLSTVINNNWIDAADSASFYGDHGSGTFLGNNVLTVQLDPCCYGSDTPWVPYLPGDADFDGVVTDADEPAFTSCQVVSPGDLTYSESCLARFDADCNGMLDSDDWSSLLGSGPVVINVQDYGTTGDGVTDDTPAIQNAIGVAEMLGGGIVRFGDGAFRVNDAGASALLIDSPNVVLQGEGSNSRLLMAGDLDDSAWVVRVTAVDNVAVRDLAFEVELTGGVDGTSFNGGGVWFTSDNGVGCENFEVSGCRFEITGPDWIGALRYHGIRVASRESEVPLSTRFMRNGLIENNEFHNSAGRAITLERVEEINLRGNRIVNPSQDAQIGGVGFQVYGCREVLVEENMIEGGPLHGGFFIAIELSSQRASGFPPASHLPTDQSTIRRNTFCLSAGGFGLTATGAHDCLIEENVLSGVADDGIRLWNTDSAGGNQRLEFARNDVSRFPLFCVRVGSGTGAPPQETTVRDNWLDHPLGENFILDAGISTVQQDNAETTGFDPCCYSRVNPGQVLEPGDFDYDGEVDDGDASELKSCLGTQDQSCLAAFDFDCDGDIDEDDGASFASAAASVFSVTVFGAVGDGLTDDTESIQEAIETARIHGGGTVFFPPGQYRVAVPSGSPTALDIESSDIRLEGEGDESLIFMNHDLDQGQGWILRVTSADNIHISKLNLEAHFTGGSMEIPVSMGIALFTSAHADGCDNFEVSKCRIQVTGPDLGLNQKYRNFYFRTDPDESPLDEFYMTNGRVLDNRFINSRGRIVQLSRSRDILISGNSFVNPMRFCVRLLGGDRITIRNNEFITNGEIEPRGFTPIRFNPQTQPPSLTLEELMPCSNVLVENNLICADMMVEAIKFNGLHDSIIRNNTINGTRYQHNVGLKIHNTDAAGGNQRILVENNQIVGFESHSIRIGAGEPGEEKPVDVEIRNNWIDRHDINFILDDAIGTTISGNHWTAGIEPCCIERTNPGKPIIQGDGNDDGVINLIDVGELQLCAGDHPNCDQCSAYYDFTADGDVDVLDFQQVQIVFGPVPGPDCVQCAIPSHCLGSIIRPEGVVDEATCGIYDYNGDAIIEGADATLCAEICEFGTE